MCVQLTPCRHPYAYVLTCCVVRRRLFVLLVPVLVLTPVPPLATGNVPDTCVVKLTPDNVPPNVKLPVVVTVPVKVIPFTVPVPPTDVTVPEPLLLKVVQSVDVK